MELIDIIVAVLLVIGLITGIKDGLVKRVLGLVGLIAGLLIGKAIYLSVAESLKPILGMPEKTTQIVAFVLILIVVPLVFSLIAWLISNLLKNVGLGWVNRLLGGLVGVLTNALILGLVFIGIESFDTHETLISSEKKEASLFFYPLSHSTGILIKDVREQIDRWRESHPSNTPESPDSPGNQEPEKPQDQLQSFEEVV